MNPKYLSILILGFSTAAMSQASQTGHPPKGGLVAVEDTCAVWETTPIPKCDITTLSGDCAYLFIHHTIPCFSDRVNDPNCAPTDDEPSQDLNLRTLADTCQNSGHLCYYLPENGSCSIRGDKVVYILTGVPGDFLPTCEHTRVDDIPLARSMAGSGMDMHLRRDTHFMLQEREESNV
jgi:hypothetical protein